MTQFQLFDAVKLTQPVLLDDNTLAPLGSPGAIVGVLGEDDAYLVEVFGPWVRRDEQENTVPARPDEEGAFQRTLDVVTLTDAEMSLVTPAGETVGAEAQLLSIVEELPQEVVSEIVDFAQFLRHKQREKTAIPAL